MQNECDEKKWSSLTGALNVSRSIKVNNYCFLVADDVTRDHGPISGHFFSGLRTEKGKYERKKIRARRAQKSRDWQRKRCLEPTVPFLLFQVSKNEPRNTNFNIIFESKNHETTFLVYCFETRI